MFCSKCGKENADDAVFCQKCGTKFDDEVETRIASRSPAALAEADRSKIFSISPTMKFVGLGYGLAIIGAFLLVVIISLLFPFLSPAVAVISALLLLLIPALYHIRNRTVRYSLTSTTIEIDRGLISRTTQNIPLRTIQDVTVSSSFVQRLLGFGDVVVDNASEDGAKLILDNIDSPRKYADQILAQIREIETR
jgi:uncharacterized membrane protein YdbT with pleckstrin-like domain